MSDEKIVVKMTINGKRYQKTINIKEGISDQKRAAQADRMGGIVSNTIFYHKFK